MDRTEIRITGFGGQGIVLSGYVIGKAAANFGGKQATMLQSFGPEARGSACSSTVVVSDGEVLYPYIHRPDVFIVMSAEGYTKYCDELKDGGTLLHDTDLVHAVPKAGQPTYGVPATRLAESLGRKLVLNIVMLGFFGAACPAVVDRDALRKAVETSVPAGTEELNLKAFDAGWEHFAKEYGGQAPGQVGREKMEAGAKAAR